MQSRDVVRVDGPQCGLMMRNCVSEEEFVEVRARWRCCAASGVGLHGGVGLRVGLIISFEFSEGIVTRFYVRFVKARRGRLGEILHESFSVLMEEVLAGDAVLQRRGHRGAGA